MCLKPDKLYTLKKLQEKQQERVFLDDKKKLLKKVNEIKKTIITKGFILKIDDKTVIVPFTVEDEIRYNTLFNYFKIEKVKEIENWKLGEIFINLTPKILNLIVSTGVRFVNFLADVEMKKCGEIEAIQTKEALEEWEKHFLLSSWSFK